MLRCHTKRLPNLFSPNDDGYNDTFMPDFSEISFQSYLFQIYDRWGELVFSTQDQAQSWDGTYRGKDCAPGVYVYFVSIETGFCNKTLLEGDVSIVK